MCALADNNNTADRSESSVGRGTFHLSRCFFTAELLSHLHKQNTFLYTQLNFWSNWRYVCWSLGKSVTWGLKVATTSSRTYQLLRIRDLSPPSSVLFLSLKFTMRFVSLFFFPRRSNFWSTIDRDCTETRNFSPETCSFWDEQFQAGHTRWTCLDVWTSHVSTGKKELSVASERLLSWVCWPGDDV